MRKREQLSVPLDPQLREFAERAAEREDRPVASGCAVSFARPRRKAARHAEPQRERAA